MNSLACFITLSASSEKHLSSLAIKLLSLIFKSRTGAKFKLNPHFERVSAINDDSFIVIFKSLILPNSPQLLKLGNPYELFNRLTLPPS